MDDMSRKYDDNTALTANAFTYESHTFSGWNTSADGSGTSYADGSKDNLTSTDGDTVTLYAMWDSESYTVTVTNDGNGSATASATSGIKGTNIKLSATPNEGYKFAGWEVISGGVTLADASSANTSFTIGTSNVEVKATFELIPEDNEPEITNPNPDPEPDPDPEPEPDIPEKDWLDDLRTSLAIAAECNVEVTVEYYGNFALPYEFMLFLKEHPNITLIYHVTYEDVEYTVTIPAGTAICSPEIEWYGPL